MPHIHIAADSVSAWLACLRCSHHPCRPTLSRPIGGSHGCRSQSSGGSLSSSTALSPDTSLVLSPSLTPTPSPMPVQAWASLLLSPGIGKHGALSGVPGWQSPSKAETSASSRPSVLNSLSLSYFVSTLISDTSRPLETTKVSLMAEGKGKATASPSTLSSSGYYLPSSNVTTSLSPLFMLPAPGIQRMTWNHADNTHLLLSPATV